MLLNIISWMGWGSEGEWHIRSHTAFRPVRKRKKSCMKTGGKFNTARVCPRICSLHFLQQWLGESALSSGLQMLPVWRSEAEIFKVRAAQAGDQDNRDLLKFHKKAKYSALDRQNISWGWICLARSSSAGRFLGQRVKWPGRTKATLWVLQRRNQEIKEGISLSAFRTTFRCCSCTVEPQTAPNSTVQERHHRDVLREVGAGEAALRGEAPGRVDQPWAWTKENSESSENSELPLCLRGGERARLCGQRQQASSETRDFHWGYGEIYSPWGHLGLDCSRFQMLTGPGSEKVNLMSELTCLKQKSMSPWTTDCPRK